MFNFVTLTSGMLPVRNNFGIVGKISLVNLQITIRVNFPEKLEKYPSLSMTKNIELGYFLIDSTAMKIVTVNM